MESHSFDPQVKRRVLQILSTEGPLTHEQLAQELGYNWDEMQQVIREMRNQDLVTITIDRRYEAEATPSSAPA
jgi:transcription initiation factor IIE alpha subunit